MTATVTLRDSLDPRSAAAVIDLTAEAATADGVAALSEASRLALGPGSPAGTRHLVAESVDRLVGYAQVWPDASVELVVAPGSRRGGVGSALWRAAASEGGARVWAHGDLASAQGFAAAGGLVAVRSLLKMGRSLTAADRSPRPLPDGYAATTYADRSPHASDPVAELQELNAAAFADHPEQGRLTVSDLRARMAEPWFDPRGLILVLDERAAGGGTGGPGPVAFHWTKIEPRDDSAPAVGEVYVVGVHPAYQGRGLAGPLTDLGLAHLAAQGCTDVILYVDGENTPARATYERAGLSVLTTDRVYAPATAVTPSAEQGRIGS